MSKECIFNEETRLINIDSQVFSETFAEDYGYAMFRKYGFGVKEDYGYKIIRPAGLHTITLSRQLGDNERVILKWQNGKELILSGGAEPTDNLNVLEIVGGTYNENGTVTASKVTSTIVINKILAYGESVYKVDDYGFLYKIKKGSDGFTVIGDNGEVSPENVTVTENIVTTVTIRNTSETYTKNMFLKFKETIEMTGHTSSKHFWNYKHRSE